MEEKTFFSAGGVSISNSRFIAAGQTYAMSGITSVKSFRQDPSRKGPVILGVAGVLAMTPGGQSLVIGLLLTVAAVFWWRALKPEFSVLLSSASGEAKALASKDGDFISSVITALNDAIVHRG